MSNVRFRSALRSPLEGVSNRAWGLFVAMLDVQPIDAISESGGFGSYDMRPRRLVELKYATKLRTKRTKSGRLIYTCQFVLPWTEKRFLNNPFTQYEAFSRSNALYYQSLLRGELVKPANMSVSGALAILHRGGRGALEHAEELFSDTRALYEKARDIF